MPSFENIHKNHKWAFVDGILCGIVLAWIGKLWYDAGVFDKPKEFFETPENEDASIYKLSDYAEQR